MSICSTVSNKDFYEMFTFEFVLVLASLNIRILKKAYTKYIIQIVRNL